MNLKSEISFEKLSSQAFQKFIIFILTWIILFVLAMRMIWKGWSSVMEEPKPRKRKIKDFFLRDIC